MKRSLTLLLILFLCSLTVAAGSEMILGAEVTEEKITDFYYTEDASSFPPLYQRYRFYTEDGKKLFYHESRQGSSWPQTEEDIVFSGTVELTEEDWSAFFDCLRGGTVRERTDEILDGDDGPWTYLYWSGDEGKYQEYLFDSAEKRLRFEELCSALAQNHVLTRFFYSCGGYIMPQSWEIFLQSGSYYFRENEEEEATLLDSAFADEILQVISEDGLESWNGFRESDPYVLDGEFFYLELRFADGTAVYASGDNAFPENYNDAIGRIDDVLTRDKMSRMEGRYRYSGEDGSFDVLLKADGTFCLEGASGSRIGEGTWSVYGNAVYMSEKNDDLNIMFGFEKDTLIYLAMGSDAFPSVTIPDEARFVRLADS